jgi:hypothetical protein
MGALNADAVHPPGWQLFQRPDVLLDIYERRQLVAFCRCDGRKGSFAHFALPTRWRESVHTTRNDERLIAKAF